MQIDPAHITGTGPCDPINLETRKLDPRHEAYLQHLVDHYFAHRERRLCPVPDLSHRPERDAGVAAREGRPRRGPEPSLGRGAPQDGGPCLPDALRLTLVQPRSSSFPCSTSRSRSFAHSRTADVSSVRASSVRPRRMSSSPRTLGSRCEPGRLPDSTSVVDDRQGRGRAAGHRDRDGAVELDDRRGRERAEGVVQQDDAVPVGLLDGGRDRVALGDGGLEPVGAEAATDPPGCDERRAAAADGGPVPAAPVLVLEQHRRAVARGRGPGSGRR